MKRLRPFGALSLALAVLAPLVGCQPSNANDEPIDAGRPDPLGPGSRIAQITNPALPNHPGNGAAVSVTGAVFTWLDTFDETADGKSRGDIYFEDVGNGAPFSGISAFDETYNPASLHPVPGDVLDFTGAYEEATSVGSAKFTAPAVLIQISKPIVLPRFSYTVPPPATIDPNDLNDFETGRKWMSMLVTVTNVTFPAGLSNSGGRVTVPITNSTATDTVEMSNELFDVATWNATTNAIAEGKTVKSITGIVTWFYNFHIAPRTPDDIVVQ